MPLPPREAGGNSGAQISTGTRVHQTRASGGGGFAWNCASCGTEHLTPFEQGCPSCGAGTPQQQREAQEAAEARRVAPPITGKSGKTITDERLVQDIVTPLAQTEVAGSFFLGLPGLTNEAKLTVAASLAMFGEHGEPGPGSLSRIIIKAWAARLYREIEDAEARMPGRTE